MSERNIEVAVSYVRDINDPKVIPRAGRDVISNGSFSEFRFRNEDDHDTCTGETNRAGRVQVQFGV